MKFYSQKLGMFYFFINFVPENNLSEIQWRFCYWVYYSEEADVLTIVGSLCSISHISMLQNEGFLH